VQTADQIKKAMRKILLVIHPDKIDPCSAEKVVICERVFNAVQSEFKNFMDSGAT
jgi:hypothetical protein